MWRALKGWNSRKFSTELSATIPGMEGPNAGLGSNGEHTLKSNSDIKAQYEKLGIDILPNLLRIIRESETGGDAVGNTKVTLTLLTDRDMIWKRVPDLHERTEPAPGYDTIVLLVTGTHFGEDGADEPSEGKKTKPIDVLPQVRVPHCPLLARVWMSTKNAKWRAMGTCTTRNRSSR